MTLHEAYQIIQNEDEGTRTDRYYHQLNQPSPHPMHSAEDIREAWRLVHEDQEKKITADEQAWIAKYGDLTDRQPDHQNAR